MGDFERRELVRTPADLKDSTVTIRKKNTDSSLGTNERGDLGFVDRYSRSGIGVVMSDGCDMRVGQEVKVFEKRLSLDATVCHVTRRAMGTWTLGL